MSDTRLGYEYNCLQTSINMCNFLVWQCYWWKANDKLQCQWFAFRKSHLFHQGRSYFYTVGKGAKNLTLVYCQLLLISFSFFPLQWQVQHISKTGMILMFQYSTSKFNCKRPKFNFKNLLRLAFDNQATVASLHI